MWWVATLLGSGWAQVPEETPDALDRRGQQALRALLTEDQARFFQRLNHDEARLQSIVDTLYRNPQMSDDLVRLREWLAQPGPGHPDLIAVPGPTPSVVTADWEFFRRSGDVERVRHQLLALGVPDNEIQEQIDHGDPESLSRYREHQVAQRDPNRCEFRRARFEVERNGKWVAEEVDYARAFRESYEGVGCVTREKEPFCKIDCPERCAADKLKCRDYKVWPASMGPTVPEKTQYDCKYNHRDRLEVQVCQVVELPQP